jgi:hypothetical protein
MRYKFRAFTGPCDTAHFAGIIATAGGLDVYKGTEHVYFSVDADTLHAAQYKADGINGRQCMDRFNAKPWGNNGA